MARSSGSSVKRNRIKRIMRETFRLNREQFPSTGFMLFSVFNSSDESALKSEMLNLGNMAVKWQLTQMQVSKNQVNSKI